MRSKVTNREFDEEIARIVEVADRTRDLALTKGERIRRFLGGAAVRETARLRARDGAAAPVVIDRASVMLQQSRTITRLRQDIRTASLVRRVKADTIVYGKVVTTGGRPASGARVVVSTDAGKSVGNVGVDEAGLFVVEVAREQFLKLVEGARALMIQVMDPSGRELAKATTPVRKRGASVVNFDLSPRKSPPSFAEPESPSRSATAGLEAIVGLGRARIARLREAGIHTLADLAGMDPSALATLLNVKRAQAEDLLKQARERAG